MRAAAAAKDELRVVVAALAREGREIILVSSGAIALGRHTLKLPKGALDLEQSQAAAAAGQSLRISLPRFYAGHSYAERCRPVEATNNPDIGEWFDRCTRRIERFL